jgi:RNA polymerase sigma-70 factor, ECF subfamily
MLRTAMAYVSSPALAEEVVQDAWLGVFEGLDSFEGRSSLRTWIFGILANCAKKQRARESRTIPFSSFENAHGTECPAEARWLLHTNPPDWSHCASSPERSAEQTLLAREALRAIADAVDALSTAQRRVIVMRDVEGWSSAEACAILGLTKANQRVLLHRARSKIRAALEQRFAH